MTIEKTPTPKKAAKSLLECLKVPVEFAVELDVSRDSELRQATDPSE